MIDSGEPLDLSYAAALEELDDILGQLETGSVDVDILADRVARGAVLVRHCRHRLRQVRGDVTAIVDDLLDDVADESGPVATVTALADANRDR